ncbi:MAG: protein kinase [Polyangiaceae bacterium]|nr:protein kinase [Polyangiaceae bacterium]
MDIAALGTEAVARVGMTTPDGWRLCSLERVDLVAATYAVKDTMGKSGLLRALHAPLARSPEIAVAFGASARVTKGIEHEDIARFIGDGSFPEGVPYVVLTPCSGETVAELVARRPGRVPPAEALRIVGDMLAVLAAAHTAGVIHGALRPDQVVITDCGTVKVFGFGTGPLLVEVERALAVAPSMMIAAFTPPEIAREPAARPTVASDLWSAGAMLYYLLTGATVHPVETAPTQLTRLCCSPARTLADVGVRPIPVLDALIDRALALVPASRFPSAATFRMAVVHTMGRPEVATLGPLRSSVAPADPVPSSRGEASPVPSMSRDQQSRNDGRPLSVRPESLHRPSTPPGQTSPSGGRQPERVVVAAGGPDWRRFDGREARAKTDPAPAGQDDEGCDDDPLAEPESEAVSLAPIIGAAWTARMMGDETAGTHALLDLCRTARSSPEVQAVTVHPWGLEGEDGAVWEPAGEMQRRVHALFGNGLRRIVLTPTLDEAGIEVLLDLPRDVDLSDGLADRLLDLSATLEHVFHLAMPPFSEPGTPDPGLEAEHREVVALLEFDSILQLEDCWRSAASHRLREPPGAWRAAVAADFSPWLEDLPWPRDPARRAAFCQRLAGDLAAEEGWPELTRSVVRRVQVGSPRGSAASRARAVHALAVLLLGRATSSVRNDDGPATRRKMAAAALTEALARCGAEGDEALTFHVAGRTPCVNGEPLCDTRRAHDLARSLGDILQEQGIQGLTLASTLTERAARELSARFANRAIEVAASLSRGSIVGVRVAMEVRRATPSARTRVRDGLAHRYAACFVEVRRSFVDLPATARRGWQVWREMARHLAEDPFGDRGAALALALVGAQRHAAARAFHAAILVAAAARAAGADRVAAARLTLATLLFGAGRAISASPSPADNVAAIALLAAIVNPADADGRAAGVIAARVAELLDTPSLRRSMRPPGAAISRPPPSRPRIMSAELVATVVDLLDSMCPPGGVQTVWTAAEALRTLAVSGTRSHHAVGALVGVLGAVPLGTVVELNDGSWGVVTVPSVHAQEFDRPTVRLVVDGAGGVLEHPTTRNLAVANEPPDRIIRVIPVGSSRFNAARAITE